MPLGAFKAALMGTAGVSAEADVVLLHDTDYSDAASASITSGIDSTYGEYIFKFYNINPATDSSNFTFQVNGAGESGYNETITSTAFHAYNDEADLHPDFVMNAGYSQAEGTDYEVLYPGPGNGSDESFVGELHLFNPASTTYAKHFYSTIQGYYTSDYSLCHFQAGYINTTTAIDEISFKMASGNFDGTIKMWGVK